MQNMLVLAATMALATPTVVMIHGAGGGGWEYRTWVAPFRRAGFRVINRDLVPAKRGLRETRFEDYVRQVEGWCPKQGPVILIGASMGGILALKAAETVHPRAVVLVNAVPPAGTGGKNYPPVVRWANGPLKDTVDSMPDSDRATIQYAWKRWRDESGAVLTKISRGVPVEHPFCPILSVIGQKDTDIPPKAQEASADRLGADILRYSGMSHVGPLLGTRSVQVATTVANWCKSKLD